MPRPNSSDHHAADKDIRQNQQNSHRNTKYLQGPTRERVANCKGRCDQCCVREHKGEPGHRESHATGTDRINMRKGRDKAKVDRHAVAQEYR